MVNVVFALAVVVLLLIGLLSGPAKAAVAVFVPNAEDAPMNPGTVPPIPQHIVSTAPSTWPTGDKLWDCCRAIAYAEGYNVANAVPARLNNPGDLSDGAAMYGSEPHSGSSVTTFPDAVTGWTWLYAKLQNIAAGRSAVYDASMSWREIGAKWAPPNAEVWATNVAARLGVDPDSSLGDYVNA